MTTLDQHQSNNFIKLIYIGDSSTGKTGSLVSLLLAGYSLKIIDMDNGLDALRIYGQAAGADLSKVEFETYRDKWRGSRSGPIISGPAKAFMNAMDKMTEWSEIEDDKTIFVLDSLTHLGRAAYAFCDQLNPGAKDKRQVYFAAQNACRSVLELLTSDDFKMNVIVISHVNLMEITEGIKKGFPNAVGSALSPDIPSYFNTMILAESSGIGKATKRRIKTMPTGIIDLKLPNPKADYELPLETGLATVFELLKKDD